jgi:hypothetical protein
MIFRRLAGGADRRSDCWGERPGSLWAISESGNTGLAKFFAHAQGCAEGEQAKHGGHEQTVIAR